VYGVRFDMNFPIFAFGRYLNAYRASTLSRRQAEAFRATTEADIAAAVTAASFDLLENLRFIETAKADEEARAQTVRDAKALFEAQSVTRDAVLESEVDHDRARRQRERLESLTPVLRMRINLLLGRPADSPLEIVDAPETGAPRWDRATVVEEALTSRPELQAARLGVAAAKRSLQATRGGELAEVRGNLSWETDNSPFGDPKDTAAIAIVLDVPLFTAGGRAARIRRSRYAVDIEEVRLQELETRIPIEVADALREVEQAYQDINVARLSIERAEESLRIQREKFTNGRATSQEVLISTSLLTDARFAYNRAVYAYNVALRDLHRARGADPRRTPALSAAAEEAMQAGTGADGQGGG
jgi:outer membrane protein TolC